MSFLVLTELQGANSVGSSQPILTEFLAELRKFAAELSEFSLPKLYSQNSPLQVAKHTHICGIVPGLGGWQEFVYVFWGGSFLLGGKTYRQNPTQNPGTIP